VPEHQRLPQTIEASATYIGLRTVPVARAAVPPGNGLRARQRVSR
jgi:hypothetical protein